MTFIMFPKTEVSLRFQAKWGKFGEWVLKVTSLTTSGTPFTIEILRQLDSPFPKCGGDAKR